MPPGVQLVAGHQPGGFMVAVYPSDRSTPTPCGDRVMFFDVLFSVSEALLIVSPLFGIVVLLAVAAWAVA